MHQVPQRNVYFSILKINTVCHINVKSLKMSNIFNINDKYLLHIKCQILVGTFWPKLEPIIRIIANSDKKHYIKKKMCGILINHITRGMKKLE